MIIQKIIKSILDILKKKLDIKSPSQIFDRNTNLALFIMDMNIVLSTLVKMLKKYKPNDRSELDQHFDIALIESQKLDAYITRYILDAINEQND